LYARRLALQLTGRRGPVYAIVGKLKSANAVNLANKIRSTLDMIVTLCRAHTQPPTSKADAWAKMCGSFDAALSADDAAVKLGALIPFVL